MGMTISKNTLRNWLTKDKTYLDELVCVLKSIALEKDSIVNCDETWCKVRKYDHYKKCYIGVLVNKARKTAIFFYENGSCGRDVLTDFLGDAELKSIMSDGYNAYVFIGNELKLGRFKDTVHQVCMSHAKNKFVKASNQGGEPTAERFSEILKEFFMRDREYDDAGLTPKERFQERQSLETKELLIELRSLLDSEQSKDSEFRSRYYKEALNYLNRFRKEIFAYLDDGELPIDNNLAERTIARGFLDGYQTMDLLAALYFGIVISANIRAQQVDDESQVQKETAYAGLGTGVLLIVIYGALSYVGVVSGAIATIDPTKDTGATVLTNLTSSLFGTFGTAFLGIVFVIACLNVCTGLIGTCATYFHTRFRTVAGRTLSYRTWQVIFTVFSFIVSNAGLSAIIKVSVPVLSALYPIAIVLVLLTLTHKSLGARFPRVYFWTVLLVGIASFATCISSLVAVFGGSIGWLDAALAMLPLQQYQLGWVVPAILGVAIGIADAPRR